MTDPKFLPVFSGWLRVMGEDVLSLANLLEAPKAPAAHRQAAAEALQSLSRLVEIIPAGIEPLGYLEGAFGFRVLAERALTEPAVTEREGLGEHGPGDPGLGDPGLGDPDLGDPDFGGPGPGDPGLGERVLGGHDRGEQPLSGEALGEPTLSGEALGEQGLHGQAEDALHQHAAAESVPAEPVPAAGEQEPAETPEEGFADGRVPRLAAEAALVAEFLGDDMPRFREKWLAPEASTRGGRAASELLYDDELRREVQRESREWVERFQAPELDDGAEELVKIEAFFRTRLRRGE